VFAVNSSYLRDEGGYHKLTIVALDSGTKGEADNLFFATKDCPFPGQFGRGKECRDCPDGGICPGGYRIWPTEGYWNPGEDSGWVWLVLVGFDFFFLFFVFFLFFLLLSTTKRP
jgi:hypothetical protein